MRYPLKTILLLVVFIIFSGCKRTEVNEYLFGKSDPNRINSTETYHVHVNSLNDGESHKKQKYTLMPGLKGVSKNNLQFKEYASYVHRAMKKSGYEKAKTNEEADIGILFAYGIGAPEKEISYETKTYASTRPSYYNYSTHSKSKTKANTKITYTRNIILDAYDYAYFNRTGKEKQVWITRAVSTGARADLREVLPVMVTAIAPHIGSNTGRQLKLIVGAPSKELYEILGKPIPLN